MTSQLPHLRICKKMCLSQQWQI